MLTREQAQQVAYIAASSGTPLAEIARDWDITPAVIYNAFKRYEIPYTRQKTQFEEHLALQAQSLTPPELYAWRAGISFPSLRRAAWENQQRMTMNTYAERKAFWEKLLDKLDFNDAKGFCTRNYLPVPMTAHWFHRIYNPEQMLLWGFTRLLVVEAEHLSDHQRFKAPDAELFALGKGKTVVPIGANIANEAFRFTRQYQLC